MLGVSAVGRILSACCLTIVAACGGGPRPPGEGSAGSPPLASGAAGGVVVAGAAGSANGSGGSGGAGGWGDVGGSAGTEPTGAAGSAAGGGGSGAGPGLTAVEAVASMGKGFNLGGMFENGVHAPSLELARAKIDAYYAKGFRHVRVPVTWTEPVGGSALVADPTIGTVDRAHPRLAALEQVVDYALSRPEFYVVLNAHHEATLKTENRAAVLEQLWHDIGEIFGQRDHRLLFELLNEPHIEGGLPMPEIDLRAMSGKAYAAIRALDPRRLVVIGGNQWFAAQEMASSWPHLDDVGGGDDAYLLATFHHYDPWTFCGDDQGSYADAWTDADVTGPFEVMRAWADGAGQGMPFFVGEWGVGWGSRYDAMECNNVRLWYQTLGSEVAPEEEVPTSVWDDGGWFAIYDHGTNAFANDLADCILGSCDWNGTERFNDGCW